MQNLQRVRRYQRELEDAEGRADQAESRYALQKIFISFYKIKAFIWSVPNTVAVL